MESRLSVTIRPDSTSLFLSARSSSGKSVVRKSYILRTPRAETAWSGEKPRSSPTLSLSDTKPVSSILRTRVRSWKTHAYPRADSPYHSIGGVSKKIPVACNFRKVLTSAVGKRCSAMSSSRHAYCSRELTHKMWRLVSPVKTGGWCGSTIRCGTVSNIANASSSECSVLQTISACVASAPTPSGTSKSLGALIATASRTLRRRSSSLPVNRPGYV
mmetsp:Transcript_28632/g.57727  ORF Transcript_28632/g.57727 Transcript_28632/m.57727 type:complete len:216 (-) Transcript_28632:62-709(-)